MIEVYLLISLLNNDPENIYTIRDFESLHECNLNLKVVEHRDKDNSWRHLCKKIVVNIAENSPFENLVNNKE